MQWWCWCFKIEPPKGRNVCVGGGSGDASVFHILNLRSLLATQREKTRLELEVQHLCGQTLAVPGSFGLNTSSQQEHRVKKDEVGILVSSNFKRQRGCNF